MADLIDTVVTAGATLTAVWLGSRLSHGISRREKLTDLRRVAYGAILAELSEVETRLEWIGETIAMHGENSYFQGGSNEEVKHRERDDEFLAKHMVAARKVFTDNYLVMSSAFVGRYEQMTVEIAEHNDDIPPTEHRHFDKAVRTARPDFLAIALREVGPAEGHWWERLAQMVTEGTSASSKRPRGPKL